MTLLGRVMKFVVVPGTLAALGYFVIGPKLGGDIVQKARSAFGDIARAPKKADATATVPSKSPSASLGGPPEPEVKVTVRPYSGVNVAPPSDEPEKPKKKRRRRRRRSTTETKPAESNSSPSSPSLPDPTQAAG